MNYNIYYELARQRHADMLRQAEHERLARSIAPKRGIDLAQTLTSAWLKLTQALPSRGSRARVPTYECRAVACQ